MTQGLHNVTLLALLSLITACTTLKTGSECYMDEQTLAGYQTFSWISANAITVYDKTQYVSPLMIQLMMNGIQTGFEDAGYNAIESEEDADFLVSAVLTTRQTHEATIYFPAKGPDVSNNVEHRNMHQELKTSGFLAIDVYDGITGQPLWRGWAEKPLDMSDRRNAKKVIHQAVSTIIAQFPAR